ncbi:Os08g0430800, partial [Oryza sativa Japonica Group]
TEAYQSSLILTTLQVMAGNYDLWSGSLHFLRVLLKILPSLSTLTGIADSIYLLRLQKQARAAAGCIPSTHFSVAMLAC